MGIDTLRIETPRLMLRPTRWEDFDAWAAFLADEESTRFLGGVQSRPRSRMCMAGAWFLGRPAMFSVIEKSSGLWVGNAGPWQPDGWPGTEVGYAFHPDAWGKGYATEACAATMDFAFDVLGWTDVIHSISPANTASQAVAQRLGSRNRGPGQLPPPLDAHEIDIWGQTRDEWWARRSTPA